MVALCSKPSCWLFKLVFTAFVPLYLVGLNAYELEIGLVLSLANIVSMSLVIPSARMRLGITFGPIVGGYLYSQVNYNSPFLASAVLIAVSLMVGLSFKDNRVTKSVKDIQIIK